MPCLSHLSAVFTLRELAIYLRFYFGSILNFIPLYECGESLGQEKKNPPLPVVVQWIDVTLWLDCPQTLFISLCPFCCLVGWDQILSRALGGKTGRAISGWDIGVTTIHLSSSTSKFFSSLEIPTTLPIIECHRDEVCSSFLMKKL